MKKKLYSVFAMVLSLVLSLSLLSGCGGKDNSGDQSDAGDTGDALTMEIAGDAWEVDGTVYHFFEGGVVVVDTGYILTYSWDGSYGEITDGGITAAMIYDEDGFFLEGEDELFYPFTYVGDADPSLLDDGDDEFTDTIDLVGTAWEMVDEEFQLHFFTNGDATSNEGGPFSYTWDGSYGEISGGGSSLEMIYDEDGFFVEFNDGTYHEFTYIGEADLNLLVESGYYDDDDDNGGWGLAGAYDNDDEEMSIVFYSDGTVVMSDFEFSDEGTYTVDGDYILMEFEGQFPYEAYYDSSDDSFQVDGLDGWFYYVDEAWYTP